MENIYLYDEYKIYLKERIRLEKRGRKNQQLLCEHAKIQPSFLSRVLRGSVHLTPEHAIGIARFWGLAPLETHYFMELVNLGRAGTQLLRVIIKERLEEIKLKASQINVRLSLPSLQQEQVQAFYYSSWLVAAIHVLISIEGFRTTKTICERLSISNETATGILSQLLQFKLIEKQAGNWFVGQNNIHLPKDSPFQSIHQSNWKHQAILNSYQRRNSLHYCDVHSISIADFSRVYESLLKTISETSKTVRDSPAEKLACINIDYFEP